MKYTQRTKHDLKDAVKLAKEYHARYWEDKGDKVTCHIDALPDANAAAKILGVSQKTIRRMVVSKELTPILGRFVPADLIYLLHQRAERRHKPTGRANKKEWARTVQYCIDNFGGRVNVARELAKLMQMKRGDNDDPVQERDIYELIGQWLNGQHAPNTFYRTALVVCIWINPPCYATDEKRCKICKFQPPSGQNTSILRYDNLPT